MEDFETFSPFGPKNYLLRTRINMKQLFIGEICTLASDREDYDLKVLRKMNKLDVTHSFCIFHGLVKQISMQPQTTVSSQLAHLVEWTIFHTQMIQLQHCHRIFCPL